MITDADRHDHHPHVAGDRHTAIAIERDIVHLVIAVAAAIVAAPIEEVVLTLAKRVARLCWRDSQWT